jgi:hypothetical protein
MASPHAENVLIQYTVIPTLLKARPPRESGTSFFIDAFSNRHYFII